MIYIVAQIVCYSYVAILIGLYTLIAATSQLDPSFNTAATLLQDLTAIRIWIVIGGLAVYSWLRASKAPTAMTLAVLSSFAWVMFIEDYMVLDSVLFVAEHPLGQAAVIMRPVFLVGLTYICFKHFESEGA